MIVPQWRGDLERFTPEVRDLTTDPALQADHERWACAREKRVKEVRDLARRRAKKLAATRLRSRLVPRRPSCD